MSTPSGPVVDTSAAGARSASTMGALCSIVLLPPTAPPPPDPLATFKAPPVPRWGCSRNVASSTLVPFLYLGIQVEPSEPPPEPGVEGQGQNPPHPRFASCCCQPGSRRPTVATATGPRWHCQARPSPLRLTVAVPPELPRCPSRTT